MEPTFEQFDIAEIIVEVEVGLREVLPANDVKAYSRPRRRTDVCAANALSSTLNANTQNRSECILIAASKFLLFCFF